MERNICGHENDPGVNFCTSCGVSVTRVLEQSVPVTSPRFGQIWRALRIILPSLTAAVPCTEFESALSHGASENHDRYGASCQESVSYIAFIGAAIMCFATALVARSNRAGLIGFTPILILLVLQILFLLICG